MTVGQELAAARRELGLSLEDVSSTTNIAVERLHAIEEADFTWLQSSIDVQPAIRAYATAVQLDAEDILRRYAAHLQMPTAEMSLAAFESEDSEPAARSNREFVYEPDEMEQLSLQPPERSVAPRLHDTLLRIEPDFGPVSTFEPNVPEPSMPGGTRLPIAALAFVSALAVTGGFLLSANRDSVDPGTSAVSPTQRAASPGAVQKASADEHAAPSAERTGLAASEPRATPTPPGAPTSSTGKAAAAGVGQSPAARDVETTTSRSTLRPPAETKAGEASAGTTASGESASRRGAAPKRDIAATRDAAAVAETSTPSAYIAVPGSSPSPVPEAATKSMPPGEISGAWNVLAQHESSPAEAPDASVPPTYRLQLEQRGARIVGSAYRVSGDRGGRPLNVSGTFTGGRLTLDLSGADRARFVLYRGGGDTFLGRVRRGVEGSGGSAIVKLERATAPDAR